ncbi:MAG: hypothetical protein JOY59_07160 [Candidatus Eremiobacteraeota bacterium]|nr:hypothetical protein [Candidatus Eremiobacteraeota bacterium]
MFFRSVLAFAALISICAAAVAQAADRPVVLTLDGRPFARDRSAAVAHGGVLFVDVVDATKAFNGLLLLQTPGRARLETQGKIALFVVGTRRATFNGAPLTLPGAPFRRAGRMYVPLATVAKLTGARLVRIDAGHADLRVTFPGVSPSPAPASTSPAAVLAIVPSASAAADGLHVSVSVRNTLSRAYTLTFPSGARATFLLDRDGSTVWDSSAGKRYTQALSYVTLAPGQTVVFSDVWTKWSSRPAGRYQLRAQLMVRPPVLSSPISLGLISPEPSPT